MDSVDFGRALKAPFDDQSWLGKTAMGFLWIILGITTPAVYGAQLEYIMRVANGNEALPEWDDFGGKWVKGFMISLAGGIYFLPIVILGAIMVVPGIISMAVSDGNSGGGLFGGGMCLFFLIAIVYGVAVSILYYAAIVHYAVKGNFGAFFQFGEIMAHVKDGTGYFAAWMWSIVVGFIVSAGMSVLSATGIGAILYPAAMYLMVMITAHLFGQWAAKSYGFPGFGAAAAAHPTPGAPGGYAPAPPAYTPPAPPAPPAYAPPAPPAPPVAAPPAYAPPAQQPAAAPPAPPAPPAYTPPAPPVAAPPAAAPPAYTPPAPPAAAPPAPPVTPEPPTQ